MQNRAQQNKLFNQKMIDMLYARDLFQGSQKLEGSFSNARAMAQLRQYYMRLLDPDDSLRVQALWEMKRKQYSTLMVEEATNKGGKFQSLPGSADVETSDQAIKLLTKLHSDLTFLYWPEPVAQRSTVNVFKESSRNNAQRFFKAQITRAVYRHIMTRDAPDKMPFAELDIVDPAATPGQQTQQMD